MSLPYFAKFNFVFLGVFFLFGPSAAQTSITGGDVSGVWTEAGSPYLINGDITVPPNQTLSIQPGVVVQFTGHYGFYVNGSLQARGSVSDSISFTVSDTTGYYQKKHIGWKGIRFQNVAHVDSSYLEYTVVEYGKLLAGGDEANGGAIYINGVSKVNIRNTTLRHNQARYGGALFVRSVTDVIHLKHLTLTANIADEDGGAIYASNSKLQLIDCKLISNAARYEGGGIYVWTADITMIRSLVLNNQGGAIKAHWLCAVVIDKSTIAGNRGAPDGFDFYRSSLHCTNSILWNKSSSNTYLEISAIDYSEVKLDYCIIKGQLDAEWKVSNSTTVDPRFTNLSRADASLGWTNYPQKDQTRSPAIDAGDPASVHDPDGTIADIGAVPFMQTSDAYPTVTFVADTTIGVTPLAITFENYATQAAGTIDAWLWDFGDGASSSEKNPIHTYEQSGTYDVKLVATNQSGKKDSLVRSQYIRALAGTIVNSPVVSGTWTKAKSPYNIYNDIQIPSGANLSIEPGVQIIFFGHYTFTVNGSLQARGTQSDSIVFTRFDAQSSWHSLRIENVAPESDSTILDYCRIEYARYISGNVTTAGGNAILVKGFDQVRVSNSLIQKNIGGRGAGIYAENADIIIRNNVIRNNSTAQYGAAIYVNTCSPEITGNTIIYNYGNTAGGIYFSKSTSIVSHNNIRNNTCYWSGAGLVISESDIYLYRNIIAYNESGHDRGGGMAIYTSSPTIVNNTISYNRAEGGEGVYITGISRPDFINNIIYSNRDRYRNYNNNGEIYLDSDSADPNFYNCNIQGGLPGITLRHGTLNGVAQNNIDSPPLFADTLKGDFSLTWNTYPTFGKSKSLCIDAGKFDSAHDPDGSVSDIGAHYFHQDHKMFEPRPDFLADTVLGFNTLPVQFTDVSDAGNSALREWHWDFGDGGTSSLQSPAHTYTSAGAFDVTLTITDENGFKKSITRKEFIRMYAGTYITGNIDGVFSDARYLVGGDITVPIDKGLTVNPGAEFVFFGNYTLKVNGFLKALGTSEEPIRFTSYDTTGLRIDNENWSRPGGWGGIYIEVSGPRDSTIIDHCKLEFVENTNKGAIYAFSNVAGIRISNNEISYNSTQGVVANSSYLIVRDNYIHHNYAASYGSGAGIYCMGGSPKVVGNIICSNRTPSDGGGITIQYSRPSIINNVICHNHASRAGGICDYEGYIKLINNTICYNSAVSSAGGYYVLYAGDVTFINTILAGNTGGELEIADPYTRVGFSHSILKGGVAGIRGYKSVFSSVNLLNVDPLVSADVSFHARPGANSPTIDAGILTNVETSLPARDPLGNPRVANGKVDIGAYEYAATTGSVARSKPLSDHFAAEDFSPFSLGLDSVFSYAHGNAYLKLEMLDAGQIDVIDASVVNGHLHIAAVPDRFGEEQIIIRATDGISEVKDTLVVHVSPVDDPPIFAIDGNLILDEDFAPEVDYNIFPSIAFGENDPAPVYTLEPSSADFVDISFSSSGVLKFVAKGNAFGAEDFTLTVSDGVHSYSQCFSLAVTAVNDAPAISIVPQATLLAGESKRIEVSVNDVEGDPISFAAYSSSEVVTLNVVEVSENEYALDLLGADEGSATVFVRARDPQIATTVEVDVVVNVVTSVEEGVEGLEVYTYPNPAEDFVVLEGASLDGGLAVFYNSKGEKLSSHLLMGSRSQLDIQKLHSGVYFLRVGLGHRVVTYRIIKR